MTMQVLICTKLYKKNSLLCYLFSQTTLCSPSMLHTLIDIAFHHASRDKKAELCTNWSQGYRWRNHESQNIGEIGIIGVIILPSTSEGGSGLHPSTCVYWERIQCIIKTWQLSNISSLCWGWWTLMSISTLYHCGRQRIFRSVHLGGLPLHYVWAAFCAISKISLAIRKVKNWWKVVPVYDALAMLW
jgi:hypothetical protein